MKNFITSIGAAIILAAGAVSAQDIVYPDLSKRNVSYCDLEINERFKQLNPHLADGIEEAERELEEAAARYEQQDFKRGAQQYVIPVVFHIIHDNGPENISDAQVHDAIRVLNEDFAKKNPDTADIDNAFKGIAAGSTIEFRLARKDPQGNPTTGIDRIQSLETYEGDHDAKLNTWPRANYMNIWVVNDIQSGAAGYTMLPASVKFNPNGDGIVIRHDYVGAIGTATASKSRTFTHEVGHWLNLLHVWGPTNEPGKGSNCNYDDGVGDTPNTIGSAFHCDLTTHTCGSLDNVQNYMDYSSCDLMFTDGQISRMVSALNSSVSGRNNLWKTTNLSATGVNQLISADFAPDRYIVCGEESIQFFDQSYYNQQTWEWTFQDANMATANIQHPVVHFTEPGIKDITLKVSDGNNQETVNKNNLVWSLPEVGEHIPFQQDMESAVELENHVYIGQSDDQIRFEYNNQVGYSSSSSYWIDNNNNPADNNDEITFGSVDATTLTDMEISFYVAYAQKGTQDHDELRLLISKDCGRTWNVRWQKSGSALASAPDVQGNFAPSSNLNWKKHTASSFLSSDMDSENLLIKFQLESDGGNNLYIDDLIVEGTYNPTPVQSFPKNGMGDRADNVIIDWKAVRGVDQYEFQLDKSANFNSSEAITESKNYISLDPGQPDTEFHTSGLTHGTTYYWRVRSVKSGTASNWSDTWSFTVSSDGVGTEELASQDALTVELYPNPADAVVNISLESKHGGTARLTVHDISGRELVQKQVNLNVGSQLVPVEITDLPNGVYFLKIASEKQSVIKKLVKN